MAECKADPSWAASITSTSGPRDILPPDEPRCRTTHSPSAARRRPTRAGRQGQTRERPTAFAAWTESEAFTVGHRQGSLQGVLADHPEVSVYEAVLTQEYGQPPIVATGPEV